MELIIYDHGCLCSDLHEPIRRCNVVFHIRRGSTSVNDRFTAIVVAGGRILALHHATRSTYCRIVSD